MHGLRKRIAVHQKRIEIVGKGLNQVNLQRQPSILDATREGARGVEQFRILARQGGYQGKLELPWGRGPNRPRRRTQRSSYASLWPEPGIAAIRPAADAAGALVTAPPAPTVVENGS